MSIEIQAELHNSRVIRMLPHVAKCKRDYYCKCAWDQRDLLIPVTISFSRAIQEIRGKLISRLSNLRAQCNKEERCGNVEVVAYINAKIAELHNAIAIVEGIEATR